MKRRARWLVLRITKSIEGGNGSRGEDGTFCGDCQSVVIKDCPVKSLLEAHKWR